MSDQFQKDVISCRQLINKASSSLEHIEKSLEKGYPLDAVQQSFEFESITEKLTNKARLLPQINLTNKEQVSENICSLLNITIGFNSNGFFEIIIPALLPRKEKGNASYIRASVQIALKKYFESNPPLNLDPIVLVFDHVYSDKRPYRAYRDHDNIEINVVIDSIAMYCLTDDSPFLCNHFYTSSVTSGDDYTRIVLVPQSRFIEWLESRQKGGNTFD